MQTPVQFYIENITARIAKHEAIEKSNPARLRALRDKRIAMSYRIAGVKKEQVRESESRYRGRDSGSIAFVVRGTPSHVTKTITISSDHPTLAANTRAIEALKTAQRNGCVECDQLRALIDTKGTNGFMAFLRSRYGKSYTVANAKEALPDWLRLRAPAACPVLV